jgi:hypothetical protein
MELKVPTAYIVAPHWTIWRIWSRGVDLAGRRGVLLAGLADTTPDGGGPPPVPACAAGMLNGSRLPAVATAAATMYLRTIALRDDIAAQRNATRPICNCQGRLVRFCSNIGGLRVLWAAHHGIPIGRAQLPR